MQLKEISESLIRGDAESVSRLTREALQGGFSPEVVLEDALIAGMKIIGERFKNNEIFVPEVLVAARAMKAGMAHLEPELIAHGVRPVGRFLIGTVKGDIHDIGKNLVGMMLRGTGFQVIDLGVNVTERQFIEAIQEHEPDIVGMSALLTTTMIQMKLNVAAFGDAGLLDTIKVMVGGAPVTPGFAEEIGANAYGRNSTEAVEKAFELMVEKQT